MKKISRRVEHEIPDFASHELVREYLKSKCGNQFMLKSSKVIDDQKPIYSLILDWKFFEDGFILFINSHLFNL